MTFYSEKQAIDICNSEPIMIFDLIKKGYFSTVDKILTQNKELINTVDETGYSIMMKLLIKREYNIIQKHIKNKNWDINFQNKEGNTFAHLLVTENYIYISKILKELLNNKNFLPNLKNNQNETILNIAIKSNQLYTVTKILQDKRFDSIDLVSFKYLYNKYINNEHYGNYSKVSNLKTLLNSLNKKETLEPKMKKLLVIINENIDNIKQELKTNTTKNIDNIIESLIY